MFLANRNYEETQENSRYLDIEVSNHMCGKRSLFVKLDESVKKNLDLFLEVEISSIYYLQEVKSVEEKENG